MSRPVDIELQIRLLDAAVREFAERGYASATMDGIGALARVTKGGVYFHFRSKEALFFAALDHARAPLRALVGPSDQADSKAAATLRRLLRDYLAFHFDHPHASQLLRVLSTELRGRFTAELREDVRSEQRLLRARLREILTRGGLDGSLFAQDPAFAAFTLASAVHGTLEQWLTAPRDAAPFCDAEHLAEALAGPYSTGSAGAPPRAASGDLEPPF